MLARCASSACRWARCFTTVAPPSLVGPKTSKMTPTSRDVRASHGRPSIVVIQAASLTRSMASAASIIVAAAKAMV